MKLVFKRIGAYILDCIIMFFALTIVSLFIPVFGNVENLNNRTIEVMDKYINQEITQDKFVEESNNINYEISKATYIQTISGIVIYILYFVVFQSYNNGQTLGKKVFKIKVVKTNGENPDINSLISRCLIPYGILVNFVLVVLILFASKEFYLNFSNVLNNMHSIVIFITVIIMFIKGRGIHDYLADTKVENV